MLLGDIGRVACIPQSHDICTEMGTESRIDYSSFHAKEGKKLVLKSGRDRLGSMWTWGGGKQWLEDGASLFAKQLTNDFYTFLLGGWAESQTWQLLINIELHSPSSFSCIVCLLVPPSYFVYTIRSLQLNSESKMSSVNWWNVNMFFIVCKIQLFWFGVFTPMF